MGISDSIKSGPIRCKIIKRDTFLYSEPNIHSLTIVPISRNCVVSIIQTGLICINESWACVIFNNCIGYVREDNFDEP